MIVATPLSDQFITSKELQAIIPFKRATLSRLSNDKNSPFPQPHRVGRTLFWKTSEVYDYLNKASGIEIQESDRLMTAAELRETFDKSPTWLWKNVKAGHIPAPFKISNVRFWLKSQIDELSGLSLGGNDKKIGLNGL